MPPLPPFAEIPHSRPVTAHCPSPLATAPVSTSRAISTSPHHLVAAMAMSPCCLSRQKHARLHLAAQSCEPSLPGTDCLCSVGLICAVYGGFQLFSSCFSKWAVKHLEILSNFSKSSNLHKEDFQLGKDDVLGKLRRVLCLLMHPGSCMKISPFQKHLNFSSTT